MLIRALSKLGVPRFAQRYAGIKEALLRAVLELVCKYHRTLLGEVVRGWGGGGAVLELVCEPCCWDRI